MRGSIQNLTSMNSDCVVCGKRITYRFSLCAECEEFYGRRVGDDIRPQWVNDLINQSRRERRAYFKDIEYVADSDPLENASLPVVEWTHETITLIAPDSDWVTSATYFESE